MHGTQTPVRSPQVLQGFTLIELLVVISIIVILVALMTPALDEAVYQAELVQCASTHRLLASGTSTYAFDQRRYYPDRQPAANGDTPRTLQWGAWNLRPVIKDHIPINDAFNDPLAPEVDFEEPPADGTYIWTPKHYFAGSGFAGNKRMTKLGDRWDFNSVQIWGTTAVFAKTFRVISVDRDLIFGGNAQETSHPDSRGVLAPYSVQHDFDADPTGLVADAGVTGYTNTLWSGAGAIRGTLDMNAAFDDGSVLRYAKFPSDLEQIDERMLPVPSNRGNGEYNAKRILVPAN